MDTKWRVLDLTEFEGYVRYERGRLVAEVKTEKVTEMKSTGLQDVDFILIGQGCQWGYGLVAGLARFDVGMAVCDWSGTPISVLTHWSGNSRVCARHNAQAKLTEPRRKNAWMRIIKAKIMGQASVLQRWNNPRGSAQLHVLANRVRSGDPGNIEAEAARTYWRQFLPDGQSFSRNPGAADEINAALNYGYTILRSRIITRITEAGLSPTLGLFHHSRDNTFALADDLIEPFRPAIDHVVLQIYSFDPTFTMSQGTKRTIVSSLDTMFGDSGESLRTSIETSCRSFARYVEGELDTYPVCSWSPAD